MSRRVVMPFKPNERVEVEITRDDKPAAWVYIEERDGYLRLIMRKATNEIDVHVDLPPGVTLW